MFKLTENRFFDENYCKYTDEYGNRLFIRKDGMSFIAKIRFKREGINADAIKIQYPPKAGELGCNFKYDYIKGTDINAVDVTDGIMGFNLMIQHWFDMMGAITMLDIDNTIIAKHFGIPEDSTEAINEYKYRSLLEFPELQNKIKSLLI